MSDRLLTDDLIRHARDKGETTEIGMDLIAAAEVIRSLTRELAEAQKDRDYWKVEAEGEAAKVAFRDKRLAEARDKALEEAAEEVNKLTVSMARIGEHPMANQSKAQAVSDLLEVTELMIRALKEKP